MYYIFMRILNYYFYNFLTARMTRYFEIIYKLSNLIVLQICIKVIDVNYYYVPDLNAQIIPGINS